MGKTLVQELGWYTASVGKKTFVVILYVILLLTIPILIYIVNLHKADTAQSPKAPKKSAVFSVHPTPTPYIFTSYNPPKIAQKDVYKIAMIGDSMTAALGPHGGGMSEYMNDLYKSGKNNQRIIIDNYAISSNILAVDNQLDQRTRISEYIFGPLMSTDYDAILIESFGYNPLSQFGIEEGIKKQNETLDKLMEKLITKRPNAVVIFIATIAPNIANFGRSTQVTNTSEDRKKQAEERIAYLKNHIEYAIKHGMPLVNIYEKSLTANGDGNLKYINANDDIHPSFAGITFIGEEAGNYIYDTKILIP